jgi:hypothetical protein
MKQGQWAIALGVLVVLVFAITFAMNYLGVGGGKRSGPLEGEKKRQLAFPVQAVGARDLNRKRSGPLEGELDKEGHVDFWFVNEHADTLKVGLDHTSCKCAGARLYVLPDDGRRRLAAGVSGIAGATGLGGPLAQAPLEVALRHALKQGATGHEMYMSTIREDRSVDVPGAALGWVEMTWRTDQVGPQTVSAKLWSGERDSGIVLLQATALTLPPLRAREAVTVHFGTLREDRLAPKGARGFILVWSSTRSSLDLEARLLGPRPGDVLKVDPPVPLTPEECSALSVRYREEEIRGPNSPYGAVLCAYRVPVTVRPPSPDDKVPIELGAFHRWVKVSSPDESVNYVQVAVKGEVVGIVQVGTGREQGLLDLGPFKRSEGTEKSLLLHSKEPGLELILDEARTAASAPFATVDRARLANPMPEGNGWRAWELSVTVKPDALDGEVPRPREDCAIYLKARREGQPDRTIRVPIKGVAGSG